MEHCADTPQCRADTRPSALGDLGPQRTRKAFYLIPWDVQSKRILESRRLCESHGSFIFVGAYVYGYSLWT